MTSSGPATHRGNFEGSLLCVLARHTCLALVPLASSYAFFVLLHVVIYGVILGTLHIENLLADTSLLLFESHCLFFGCY